MNFGISTPDYNYANIISILNIFSEEHPVIHQGVVAQSCVVDNEGSNIFFVEGEARNIQVVSTDPVSTIDI